MNDSSLHYSQFPFRYLFLTILLVVLESVPQILSTNLLRSSSWTNGILYDLYFRLILICPVKLDLNLVFYVCSVV